LLYPRSTSGESPQLARRMRANDQVNLTESNTIGTAPQFQLRCEPDQRAIIGDVGGVTAAQCIDERGGMARESVGSTTIERSPYTTSEVRPTKTSLTSESPRRTTNRLERRATRDWTKTALVIGGSSAAGAGIGALVGGKRGALIGAALAGGVGT